MSGDAVYMRRALKLARTVLGETAPNPMVGAVLVRDGSIIGEGYHHRAGEPHAEIEALRDAAARGHETAGATIYVTLEPCSTAGRTPPCTEALIRHGIARVVIGVLDPNPKHAGRGVSRLEAAGIAVRTGVMRRACEELNRGFFRWITAGRPWVVLKMAVTLDGRIATRSGDSRWITGPAAREAVQDLRRRAGAIMVGAATAELDHPSLRVKDPGWQHQPVRLIAGSVSPEQAAQWVPGGAEVVSLPDRAAWERLLDDLGKREILELLIEGGGTLAASALRAGIVDEAVFFVAPKILGGTGSRPAVGGADPARIADAIELEDIRVRRFGRDTMIAGLVPKKGETPCSRD